MTIQKLFEKDINRDINGVIKVGQIEEGVIKTELEEYVLTPEARREFNRLFAHFVQNSGSDQVGVWISGFFGSGKSHFLKMLSYLLANKAVQGKNALEWFRPQVKDATLEANLERASEPPAEVMLFNIDAESASDGKQSKSAIVQVLQKAFDNHRGFFGADPSIARFERLLEEKNQYSAFRDSFANGAGIPWSQGREEWGFSTGEIAATLEVCGYTPDTAQSIVAERERFIANSPKEFALEVQKYLKTRPGIRLVFMVDEVGQYIGKNSDLMLNLQTVVEELGSHNPGRAWVMVTSQEDLDSLIGIEGNSKRDDFSKIQGRFLKPVILSSTHADTVIQLRVLEKTQAATASLEKLYGESETLLGNVIRFETNRRLPNFKDASEFARTYPFVPYQFFLLQDVFTQTRRMGASGKHLASGERSMLDAYKLASQALQHEPVGTLAPFHLFYRAIASFLDSAVTRVIDQAAENERLQKPDVDLLKTLFMIKYIDNFPGKLENLTTLSIGSIDEDRIALKKRIEASLGRLEDQTLINRNGDTYTFLTDDEQDVGRLIKNTSIEPGSAYQRLQEMLWEEVFTDKKFRPDKRHEFGFNRALDGKAFKSSLEQLGLNVIPADSEWHAPAQETLGGKGGNAYEALIVLPGNNALIAEIRTLVQTENFLLTANLNAASPQLKIVIESKRNEKDDRKKRIYAMLESDLCNARVQVLGRNVAHNGENSKAPFRAALEALVKDHFTKLDLVQSAFETDNQVDAALAKSILESPNSQARTEIKTWLERKMLVTERVSVKELLENFSKMPFGWPELDTLGVTAELLAQGELELRFAQAEVKLEAGLSAKMRGKAGLESYALRVPRTVDPTSLNAVRELARETLGNAAPATDPKELAEDLRRRIGDQELKAKVLLEKARNNHLFVPDLEQILEVLRQATQASDTASLIDKLRNNREPLEQALEQLGRIERFFEKQLGAFNAAKSQVAHLESDLANLNDPDANAAVQQAKSILNGSDPSKDLPRIPNLLEPAVQSVKRERERLRAQILAQIEQTIQDLSALPVNPQALENLRLELPNLERLDAILARGSRVDGIANHLRHEHQQRTQPETAGIKQTSLKLRRGSIRDRAELETYLNELRSKIGDALEQGAIVNLE